MTLKAVLTYHSLDSSGSPISVPEASFAGHMRWLADSSVRVVPLADLVHIPEEQDAIALTFDDAFSNFSEFAWPLLSSYGFPVTLFVVTDRAGSTNDWGGRPARGIPSLRLLDWEALARLAEQGVTLGSHTRTHPNLVTADPAALLDEVEGAAHRVRVETGRAPEAFAYPYGAYDQRVVRAVGRVHRIACTTQLRPFQQGEDILQMPRLDAYYFQRPDSFEDWGSASFRRYIWLRAGARRLRRVLANARGTA